MDAILMLEEDHRNAKKAMEAIAASPLAGKKALFDSLKLELEGHDKREETIFYPAIKANPKTAGLPAADKAAHLAVEKALAELAKLPMDDPRWGPDFAGMQSKLIKHIQDEEFGFFVKVREALSAEELNVLGAKLITGKAVAA